MIRSDYSHLLFVWTHPIVSYLLLNMSIGLVALYQAVEQDTDSDYSYKRMLGCGAAFQMFVLTFVRASHKGFHYTMSSKLRVLHFLVRLLFGIFHLLLLLYEGPPEYLVMYHALNSLAVNFLDIYVALNKNGNNVMIGIVKDKLSEIRATSLSEINKT
jgi:hypothetical protein